MPLSRTAIGRSRNGVKSKPGGGRRVRVSSSTQQHARKRLADAQKASSPVRPGDQGPSELAEEMMRKRDEFQRDGKTTLHEGGKVAMLERTDNGVRIRFFERKGAAPQVLTFTTGDDAGKWFEANFPKHSRV